MAQLVRIQYKRTYTANMNAANITISTMQKAFLGTERRLYQSEKPTVRTQYEFIFLYKYFIEFGAIVAIFLVLSTFNGLCVCMCVSALYIFFVEAAGTQLAALISYIVCRFRNDFHFFCAHSVCMRVFSVSSAFFFRWMRSGYSAFVFWPLGACSAQTWYIGLRFRLLIWT